MGRIRLTQGIALVAAGVVTAGCPRWARHGNTGLDDSTFVTTMAALRRAVLPGGAETTRDSSGRAAVRDSIMRKYGTTPAGLESAAHRLALRPDHAADVLRAIDRQVQLDAVTNSPPTTSTAPAQTGQHLSNVLPVPSAAKPQPPGLLTPPRNRARQGPLPRQSPHATPTTPPASVPRPSA